MWENKLGKKHILNVGIETIYDPIRHGGMN
jgi:hypothetical protein